MMMMMTVSVIFSSFLFRFRNIMQIHIIITYYLNNNVLQEIQFIKIFLLIS